MTRREPDYTHPYWVQGFWAEDGEDFETGEKWKANTLATESVHRDEFIRNIELALLDEDPRIGVIEHGRNPKNSFYKGPIHALHEKDQTPKTPCYVSPERPCIEISHNVAETYRIHACQPGQCNRFQTKE